MLRDSLASGDLGGGDARVGERGRAGGLTELELFLVLEDGGRLEEEGSVASLMVDTICAPVEA